MMICFIFLFTLTFIYIMLVRLGYVLIIYQIAYLKKEVDFINYLFKCLNLFSSFIIIIIIAIFITVGNNIIRLHFSYVCFVVILGLDALTGLFVYL